MIKILGGIFIIFSTTLIGFMYANKIQLRYRQISDIIKILTVIQEQLKYSKASCQGILKEIGRREIADSTDIIDKFLNESENQPFPIRWENAVDSSNLVLEISEYNEVRGISDILGAFSAQEQIVSFQGILEFFKIREKEIREETQNQSKLYKAMGLLAGVALVIILI